ncbi:hypothetical protein ACVWZA_002376 [Sphingomonas sp. UYAg733]
MDVNIQATFETAESGESDMRKPWQTPAVIEPARVKSNTGYTPGLAGDSYTFSNVTS